MAQKYGTDTLRMALSAVWVALMLATSFLPAYPILGTSAVITLASILFSSLTAPLLGPIWGMISGVAYGWSVSYLNPGTSIGPLTFLSPSLAALMSGLVLFNRWKEATCILVAEIEIWFLHPFAWYGAMPIITWQYWLVLVFIVVAPVRKWITTSIITRNQKTLPIALWCIAWIARIGGDVATGNNIAVWVLNWGTPEMYPFWAPMTIYYAIADSLNCLAGGIIGAAVLLALKRANIRIPAVDSLEAKIKEQK